MKYKIHTNNILSCLIVTNEKCGHFKAKTFCFDYEYDSVRMQCNFLCSIFYKTVYCVNVRSFALLVCGR